MAKIEKLCDAILKEFAGAENISNCAYCMTRLRLTAKDPSGINDEAIKNIDGVMGLVHDKPDYYEVVVGPGTSKKCADYCNSILSSKNGDDGETKLN